MNGGHLVKLLSKIFISPIKDKPVGFGISFFAIQLPVTGWQTQRRFRVGSGGNGA